MLIYFNKVPPDIPTCMCVYVLKNFRTGHRYVGATQNARRRFLWWKTNLKSWDDWGFLIAVRTENIHELRRVGAKVLYYAEKTVPRKLLLNTMSFAGRKKGGIWSEFLRLPDQLPLAVVAQRD